VRKLKKRIPETGAFLLGLALGFILFLGTDLLGPATVPGVSGSKAGSGSEKKERSWDPSLGSEPRFTDITEEAGVDFEYVNGLSGEYHYPEIMGAGTALFDYDGDGFLDIYFVNGNHLVEEPSPEITNRLYRNNGDGTFTDVTKEAGVGDSSFGQGCCVGDYDNDGDPDLYVSNFGANVLYRNNGDGTFTNVAKRAGVDDPAWGQTCSFLDYDRDGRLDLYVQNYLTYSLAMNREAYTYVGDRKVVDYPAPSVFKGAPDRLFRNNGDGTFTDVTSEAGIGLPGGKGMGCACADLDDDGWCDIYVTNDGMENYCFRNLGNGKFEEVGLAVGLAFSGVGGSEASMGVDVGDFDRDGRLDLIVPCLWRQAFTLYRNEGDHFTDVSASTGLVQATSRITGFSPSFIDYDNDGDLDLFFSTGGVRMNELASPDASYEERYGIRDVLLANDGSGRFVNVSDRAGPHFRRRTIGRGTAAGDIDNDGDLDLVINNLVGRPVILRNETEGGHWITLIPVPREGNRDGLGTKIWITVAGRRYRKTVHGGVTYLSQNDRRVHFGLGREKRVERIEIRWPNGEREVLRNVAGDRFLVLKQGSVSAR